MNEGGPHIVVAGFYPPPITGQAVATERLAALLEEVRSIARLNLNVRETAEAARLSRFEPRLVLRALQRRRSWRRTAAQAPSVLWTSLSPSRWGSLRDLVLMGSVWQPSQRVWGVVHHGDFDAALQHPLRRHFLQRTLARLSGVVLLSESLRERARPHLRGVPAFVIPNTLDAQSIATPDELAQRRTRTTAQPRLLFFSNMIEAKGYADVLAATHLLHQRGVTVRATFAGAWPGPAAEAAFRHTASRLGIEPFVQVLGPVSDPERKRRLFLDADVFVLPTYYPTEAQPLTILEALATGTPVITTRQGGIPEMIDEDAEGFFVPSRDPSAIADAAEKLIDPDVWLRVSRAARARFDRQFHPDVVRQQWLALLDGTLPNA